MARSEPVVFSLLIFEDTYTVLDHRATGDVVVVHRTALLCSNTDLKRQSDTCLAFRFEGGDQSYHSTFEVYIVDADFCLSGD